MGDNLNKSLVIKIKVFMERVVRKLFKTIKDKSYVRHNTLGLGRVALYGRYRSVISFISGKSSVFVDTNTLTLATFKERKIIRKAKRKTK